MDLKYLKMPKSGVVRLTHDEVKKEEALRQRRMITIIGQILSNLGVVLVIDGLDEVEVKQRRSAFDEIETLSNAIIGGQVIATCRSGEFVFNLEGFSVVEIQPLSTSEIDEFVDVWSRSPTEFKEEIASVHYSEVLNRPLFLAHLITLFDDSGRLPRQSSDVYRLIINLLLERWDLSRRIDRSGYSSYASKGLDEKIDILASIGFFLLFRANLKYFDDAYIGKAFDATAEKYGLPNSEKSKFIRDIQSHTGLIVQTSVDEFGFSHYSLHEYLCAYYLVRQPSIQACTKHFLDYREVVAIAVCLSSSKEEFLLQLVSVLFWDYRDHPGLSAALRSFLHRLSIENPRFVHRVETGFAFLAIMDMLYRNRNLDVAESWRSPEVKAFSNRGLVKAVGAALRYYNVQTGRRPNEVTLRLQATYVSQFAGLPDHLTLHEDFWSNLSN